MCTQDKNEQQHSLEDIIQTNDLFTDLKLSCTTMLNQAQTPSHTTNVSQLPILSSVLKACTPTQSLMSLHLIPPFVVANGWLSASLHKVWGTVVCNCISLMSLHLISPLCSGLRLIVWHKIELAIQCSTTTKQQDLPLFRCDLNCFPCIQCQ